MPIYTYHCEICGFEEDKVLSIEHEKPNHCNCEMFKVFNPISFRMVESIKEKVTGGLGEATWMNPQYQKRAMSGFERQKTIF